MKDQNHNLRLQLRSGDFVEIRSKDEILATLDGNGAIDGLPFMPEMLQYCGQNFRVHKVAHKTCDTVNKTGIRSMKDAVHLEGVRCNGAFHGGCQAGCLIFWKEAWLKQIPTVTASSHNAETVTSVSNDSALKLHESTFMCNEEILLRMTQRARKTKDAIEVAYSCQVTELPKATEPLKWWNLRQYAMDLRSGNVSVSEFVHGIGISAFNLLVGYIRQALVALHRITRSRSVSELSLAGTSACVASTVEASNENARPIKSLIHRILANRPSIHGNLKKTPSAKLELQPGEFVTVKSQPEIVETLDSENKNRGLLFDVEMLPYCGGTYQVLRRVEKIIDEKSGHMIKLPNDCIVLDGVVCKACYSTNRLFCPRGIYSYWREIWLKRVE